MVLSIRHDAILRGNWKLKRTRFDRTVGKLSEEICVKIREPYRHKFVYAHDPFIFCSQNRFGLDFFPKSDSDHHSFLTSVSLVVSFHQELFLAIPKNRKYSFERERERKRWRGIVKNRKYSFERERDIYIYLFVGWLLNVPATCECISGTGLLRPLYVLPH